MTYYLKVCARRPRESGSMGWGVLRALRVGKLSVSSKPSSPWPGSCCGLISNTLSDSYLHIHQFSSVTEFMFHAVL